MAGFSPCFPLTKQPGFLVGKPGCLDLYKYTKILAEIKKAPHLNPLQRRGLYFAYFILLLFVSLSFGEGWGEVFYLFSTLS